MKTLHRIKKVRLIQPHFGTQFHCLGDACPEDCCTGWTVSVDQASFESYKKSQHVKLKTRFQSMVHIGQEGSSKQAFGIIAKDPSTNACCFLEDRLCAIQKTQGSDKLSHTCFTFPRSHRKIDQFTEQAFTLSCPEVARLALLKKNAFEFEQNEVQVRIESISRIPSNMKGRIHSTIATNLRIFSIGLMKNDRSPTWEKLATIGVVCESLSRAHRCGELTDERAKSMIEGIEALVSQGKISNTLSMAASQPMLQAEAFSLLLQVTPFRPYTDKARQRLLNALEGLKFSQDRSNLDVSELAQRYEEGVLRLTTTLSHTPWFLDHLVISDLWWNVFPFNRDDPYTSYIGVVTRFGIIRMLLAGSCMHNPQITVEELAQVVQTFYRHYQHNQSFASNVDQCLERSGWNKLDRIFLLLKATDK